MNLAWKGKKYFKVFLTFLMVFSFNVFVAPEKVGATTFSQTALSGLSVKDVTFSPDFAADGTVFATSGQDLYRSTDRGLTWAAITAANTSENYTGLAISPDFANDGTLLAGKQNAAYKSTDGGDTWTDVTPAFAGSLLGFVPGIPPTYAADGIMLLGALGNPGVGSSAGYVFNSQDEGGTWSLSSMAEHMYAISGPFAFYRYHESPPLYRGYVPTSQGIRQTISSNSYASWSGSTGGGSRADLAVASNGDKFAVHGVSLMGSPGTDPNGDLWSVRLNSATYGNVRSVEVSPAYAVDETVFAGVDGTVYRSRDKGVSWEDLGGDFGLRAPGYPHLPHSMGVAPDYASSRLIIVGTTNGIWRGVEG